MIFRLIIFCSGANKDILKLCPTEQDKFISIGLSVILTAILASISGGYSIYMTFGSMTPAVLFGLLWGAIIFNIDRYIVSSTINVKGKKLLFAIVPRVLISLILSVTISKPLELKLFDASISERINNDRKINKIGNEKRISDNKSKILAIIKSESKIEVNDVVLNNLVDYKNKLLLMKQGISVRMRQDTSRALRSQFYNNNAKILIAEKDIEIRKREINSIIRVSEKQSAERIKGLQNQLKLIDEEIMEVPDKSADILHKLKALSELKESNETVMISSTLITLLFILIELSPILIKLTTSTDVYCSKIDEFLSIQNEINGQIIKNNDSKLKYKLIIELKTNQTTVDYIEKKRLYLKKINIDKWYDKKLSDINMKNK